MTPPRIFVVEDEFLLATFLEEELAGFGFAVVGPFGELNRAREAAARETFDAAVLDVNLSGTMVFPLADDLIARGVPFVFLTGYAAAALPERFRMMPRLAKPSDPVALERELRRVLAESGKP